MGESVEVLRAWGSTRSNAKKFQSAGVAMSLSASRVVVRIQEGSEWCAMCSHGGQLGD